MTDATKGALISVEQKMPLEHEVISNYIQKLNMRMSALIGNLIESNRRKDNLSKKYGELCQKYRELLRRTK